LKPGTGETQNLAALPHPALSTTLLWLPWERSIVPAWRAMIQRWMADRELCAVLTLNSGGRARVVLRIESGPSVECALWSQDGRGIKDGRQAQQWAQEAIVEVLRGDLGIGLRQGGDFEIDKDVAFAVSISPMRVYSASCAPKARETLSPNEPPSISELHRTSGERASPSRGSNPNVQALQSAKDSPMSLRLPTRVLPVECGNCDDYKMSAAGRKKVPVAPKPLMGSPAFASEAAAAGSLEGLVCPEIIPQAGASQESGFPKPCPTPAKPTPDTVTIHDIHYMML